MALLKFPVWGEEDESPEEQSPEAKKKPDQAYSLDLVILEEEDYPGRRSGSQDKPSNEAAAGQSSAKSSEKAAVEPSSDKPSRKKVVEQDLAKASLQKVVEQDLAKASPQKIVEQDLTKASPQKLVEQDLDKISKKKNAKQRLGKSSKKKAVEQDSDKPPEKAVIDQSPDKPTEQATGAQSPVGWTIRVLCGPHSGAEMDVSEGLYKLGRSEHNDIILSDTALAMEHCELVFGSEGMSCRLLSDSISSYVAGKKVKSSHFNVQPFEVFSFGKLHFVYGNTAENWPDISIPKRQPEQTAPKKNKGSKQAKVAKKGKVSKKTGASKKAKSLKNTKGFNKAKWSIQDIKRLYKEPWSIKDLQQRAKAAWSTMDLKSLHKTLRPKNTTDFLYKSLWLTAITLFVATAYSLSINDGVFQTEQELTDKQRLKLMLDNKEYSNLQVVETRSGQLQLEGYVNNNKQNEELESLITTKNIDVLNRSRTIEKLTTNLSYILDILGYKDLHVKAKDGQGNFVVTGYLENAQQWPKLKESLRRDVAGVKSIAADFDTIEVRASWLKKQMQQMKMDYLMLRKEGGAIVIVGKVPSGKMVEWKSLEERFLQKYQGKPTIRFSGDNYDEIFGDITGVSIGAHKYLITKEGHRITAGGRLNNGYTVESIDDTKVVLSKEGSIVNYMMEAEDNE